MHVTSLLPKIAAAVSGLYAAWLWLQASKVPTLPDWMLGLRSEPIDPDVKLGSTLTPEC